MTQQITIQYIAGCPNAALAAERVESAIRLLEGSAPAVTTVEIADLDEASRKGFRGSPAVLFDGVDAFAAASSPPAFACRVYETGDGREGAPSVRQILDVLASKDLG
ncbi:MAG: thioredoxin family protein [Acidimicrobiales bacterium]